MDILHKELPCSPGTAGCVPHRSSPGEAAAIPTDLLHVNPGLAAGDWVCSNSWVKPKSQTLGTHGAEQGIQVPFVPRALLEITQKCFYKALMRR